MTRIFLLSCVAVIFATGLLMVFNTSSAVVLDRTLSGSTHVAVVRHIVYLFLGVMMGSGIYAIGHERVLRHSTAFLILITFLLLLVYVPGIGQMRNGARRWLALGTITFQPSEIAKIAIPAFFIHFLKEREGLFQFLLGLTIVSIPMALITFEPDNGTTAIIVLTLLALFLVAKVRLRYWLLPMMVLGCVAVWAALQLPYVHNRLEVYLNPSADLLGKGHQPYQAKIAAGSGGALGRGVGHSLQKLNYLPEAQNDYIAAIFAEEVGFVGILILLFLYMSLAALGFSIASRANSRQGFQLAAMLTFLLTMQAFLNLGVVSGLVPSKGLNLPFFSQGGTSLIANCIAIALLVHIDRKREVVCAS